MTQKSEFEWKKQDVDDDDNSDVQYESKLEDDNIYEHDKEDK